MVVKFKSPISHTEPILMVMNQLKLSDMYTCYIMKFYYKLYRNRLPLYFANIIPVYGESRHSLCNRWIHLPDIKCEFCKINTEVLRYLGKQIITMVKYRKVQNHNKNIPCSNIYCFPSFNEDIYIYTFRKI